MGVPMLGYYSTSLSRGHLKNYFLDGCKKEADFAVGVEWEKIGVLRESGEAIRYAGPRGVRAIFEALVQKNAWIPVFSAAGMPIALKKGTMSITLEPGGQVELSGQKAKRLKDNADELYCHLKEIKEVSRPLDIVWLGLGAQPFSTAHDIEWVPKDRYDVMREKLQGRGALTFSMMKETASVQISLDYSSESDAIEKLRLAMALSPVLTALFANSPLEKGRGGPYLSRRAHIWRHTAPERSGIVWKVFDPSFTLEDYVEYALDVPLLFLQRNDGWIGVGELSFRDFLERGWKDLTPEPADWDLHLTSLFTEARLKKYIEIRSVDCQTPPLGLAAVAFVKGLFYDADARRNAWKQLESWSLEERKRLMDEVPVHGLQTKIRGAQLRQTAAVLAELAEQGLAPEERDHLKPMQELLGKGQNPAQKLLSCLQESPDPSAALPRLFECCEI